MQSVSSNAVAKAIGEWETIYSNGGGFIKGCTMQWGKLLRIRMAGTFGNFTSQRRINNGFGLYTIPSTYWRPSSAYSPNRFLIAVDTTTVRLPCNIDLSSNGSMNMYFEGNTPLGGGVDNVAGLFCDVLLLLQ